MMDAESRYETIYTPGGDNHLVIYYSEETNFMVCMMVQAYMRGILEAKIPGVTEVTNGEGSLMVHFDPTRIRYEDLLREVREIEDEWAEPERWATTSRLFEIPVWFDDPWSKECYLLHKTLHQVKDGSMSNFEYCAWLNGKSKREFIEKMTAPQYLIFGVGFAPGVHGLFPLVEKQNLIQLPKYEVSRPWTPPRVFVGGGVTYSIHPYVLPGGFQMLGNTPVPMSSLEPAEKVLPALKDRLALATLGDRFRLRAIEKEEYDEIRAKVVEGTYAYQFIDQKWEPKKWIEDPNRYKGAD